MHALAVGLADQEGQDPPLHEIAERYRAVPNGVTITDQPCTHCQQRLAAGWEDFEVFEGHVVKIQLFICANEGITNKVGESRLP